MVIASAQMKARIAQYFHVDESWLFENAMQFPIVRARSYEGICSSDEEAGDALHAAACQMAREDEVHSPANPRFRPVVSLWKRIPFQVAKTLGPALVRRFP